MNLPDDLLRENQALRQRLALLSQASLSINESLDFRSVLQEVVDSARSLTASRYGAITVFGEDGQTDFIVSGMTQEEHQGLWDMREGLGFFEYLSGLAEPLRVPNIDDHLRALNMPEFLPSVPVTSLLVAPIRHHGVGVGTIYLTHGEEGGEFTPEDEETLALFAAQAALAIANARRHREERRARAGLETLIETSPVGVAVLDAGTGLPVSFNREAMRIVDSLRDPGQTPEDLLNRMTFRRADGREVSLREFPLAGLLSSPETVQAEEIVLRVPDGRSVTVLLNAAPILGEDGAVESFMVTLQDLAAVEETERLRADFLAMVSHELRVPLTSIKGSAATILDSVADLDPAVVRQFVRIMRDQADHMNGLVSDLLDVARIETGALPVSPEPAEVAALVDRARRALGSAGGGNILEIDIPPDLPLVLADRGRVVQVLVNLLTNAARHSPPGAAVRVSAAREGVHVAVTVSDQGRGIPAERLPHLFRKFSGVNAGEPGGDAGLGLAICKGIVEAHGGRIRAESGGPGLGASFTFTLPTVGEAGDGTASSPASNRSSRPGQGGNRGTGAGAGGGRRPPGTAPYPRHPGGGGLPAGGHRGPGGGPAPHGAGAAPTGPAGPDAARHRRHRADAGPAGYVADVPVIFLSAYGREELVSRALDAGAADYMVKPFSPTELGGPHPGRPAAAGGVPNAGILRLWRPVHRPRRPPGDPGRQLRCPCCPWSTGCWRSWRPTPGGC